MEDYIVYIAAQFQGRDSEIRALMRDNGRFQELAQLHYELKRRLEALQPSDDPRRFQQLESELRDVEREITGFLQVVPFVRHSLSRVTS